MSFDPSKFSVSVRNASIITTVEDTRDGSSTVLQTSPVQSGPSIAYQGRTNENTSMETKTYSGVVKRNGQPWPCTVTDVSRTSTYQVLTIHRPLQPPDQSTQPAEPARQSTSDHEDTLPSKRLKVSHEPYRPLTQGESSSSQHVGRGGSEVGVIEVVEGSAQPSPRPVTPMPPTSQASS